MPPSPAASLLGRPARLPGRSLMALLRRPTVSEPGDSHPGRGLRPRRPLGRVSLLSPTPSFWGIGRPPSHPPAFLFSRPPASLSNAPLPPSSGCPLPLRPVLFGRPLRAWARLAGSPPCGSPSWGGGGKARPALGGGTCTGSRPSPGLAPWGRPECPWLLESYRSTASRVASLCSQALTR